MRYDFLRKLNVADKIDLRDMAKEMGLEKFLNFIRQEASAPNPARRRKVKKETPPSVLDGAPATAKKNARKKRKLSPEGRAAIAAAQKKRWAKKRKAPEFPTKKAR